jgi:hypothetical protein
MADKVLREMFYAVFTRARCDPDVEYLPSITFDVCYTTADPISTKGYILGLPQLNLLCTSSWHEGNVGSCGTNLLIPHSAKGLRLLDQPDRRFARQVVPEHGDRRSVVGKLEHIVNEKMWMEMWASERPE